ncbi:MAG: ankyrin repeat domain-containing protein [Pseudobdellovibrionaceae bacterium]|nr:ankyrin repeat domain-containing protein [Pseudobdellovibrionaceae bacterium]
MRTWDDFKTTIRTEPILFRLAREGDLDAIQTLQLPLELLNAKDAKGHSALMLAAYNGHKELTRYLLDEGADPNSQDQAGNSILMGAAFKGDLPIVKMLVEAGADGAAKNPNQQDALAFAEMFGRNDVANYLRSSRRNQDAPATDDSLRRP